MPKGSNHSAIARQWELLRRLPTKGPGITVQELADRLASAGFATSKRTVERDLIDLCRIFPLVRNDKGTPHGWHWMAGASAELPGLALSDAISLRLVEDLLRLLLPAAILTSLGLVSEGKEYAAWEMLRKPERSALNL